MALAKHQSKTAQVASRWAKLRPDIDSTSFSIMLHLSRMGVFATRQADKVASQHGINEADARLMMAIRSSVSGKPLRPSELSERMDLKRATITHRVNRLLEKGLAERSSDADDGRALNVRLTAEGTRTIDAIMSEINTACQEILQTVDQLPGGRGTLSNFLVRLVAAWEQDWAENRNASSDRDTAK